MSDNNTKDLQDQIKANKSMAQQNIDLQQEVDDLKNELIQTEARLMSTIQTINKVMSASEGEVNKVHKHLQKNISALTDWVGEPLSELIQTQIDQDLKVSHPQQLELSTRFRLAEGKNPLVYAKKEDKKEDNHKKK